MKASQDTLENLIRQASAFNQELYFSILEDSSSLVKCDDTVPALLKDVPELRMDVKFIMVDLQTIICACFSTDRFYEKRYHLKNLYAGMLEGYKLLYGFGNMRKCTIWYRIGEDLQHASESSHLFDDLKCRYDKITENLLSIEATKTDQDDRNLTYHYDDDLLLVYRLTLKTDSEEKACLKFLDYLKVLGSMLTLINEIEIKYAFLNYSLPDSEVKHDDLALMIIQNVSKTLGQHPQMPSVLLVAVDKGASQIDSFAKMKKDAVSLQEFIGKTVKIKCTLPEIEIVKGLLDVEMLVSFMIADASTILRSFIGAGSKAECPLALRRLTISRVSTLNHLIGYRKDDSDSMWGRIMSIIPEGNTSLMDEAHTIEQELKSIRKKGDLDTRALYVHLIENKKWKSNIPSIVKALESPTILTELQASQDIIKVCGEISKFLPKLMNVLSAEAHRSRIESDRKLKKKINEISQLADHPNCPDLLRDSMRQQLDVVEKMLLSLP